MPVVEIFLNKTVNPCRLTSNGYYCLNYHSLYLVCDSSNRRLYNKYGWYLGSIIIVSNNLNTLKRDSFRTILSSLENKLDLKIKTGESPVNVVIEKKLAEIINLINTSLPDNISKLKVNEINIKTLG